MLSKTPLSNPLYERFVGLTNLDMAGLPNLIAQSATPAKDVRRLLLLSRSALDGMYLSNANVSHLIQLKAWFMDLLLAGLWARFKFKEVSGDNALSLIAVGGYGRGELHPYSDIDLLILSELPLSEEIGTRLSSFITLLWDLKLDIGHSVRTIEECISAAREDVTICTNLLETRTIAGSRKLRKVITERIYSAEVFTHEAYFHAKRTEQMERHEKYSGTEYNLEPNLKSSPGTLRDIQTVTWITKHYFGPKARNTRQRYHYLTDEEFNLLLNGEQFLWQLRYGLQMISERNENRLLFDHQRKLADILGYRDSKHKLGVEQMMQKYYRVVLGLGELTDLILQYFVELYRPATQREAPKQLNKRFHVINGYIEANDLKIFERSPYAMIEIFLMIAQHPDIVGIRSATIRAMRESQTKIDESFRNNLANTTLFMEILRTPHRLDKTLNLMLKYNVLGRYLPEFGAIIGQMQHDLFHCYTVDAHTIHVIQNLCLLDDPATQQNFPMANRLIRTIPKREVLYLAALYHDIAKGRGGDHSTLGAEDAIEFCERHHLSERDTKLICWLVEHHLMMSTTSQKKDIADPDVIHEFALKVPSLTHLEYLYLLTCCDIAATNPNLWNSWRSSLLQQLYIETRRAIRRGMDAPIDRKDWIRATQQEVRSILFEQGFAAQKVDALLESLEDDYFLQDSTAEIAWQTAAILNHGDSTEPLVIIRDSQNRMGEGFSQIMIYLKSEDDLFAATTAVLEQLNLNVLNARISTSGQAFSLSNFIVTDAQNRTLATDPERKRHVQKRLIEELDDPEDYPEIIKRRTPRQLKHFSFPTEVTLSNDRIHQRTVMEVVTPDRPGLLARIGQILLKHRLSLTNARIATLGERVEDVFFITDAQGKPISDGTLCQQLIDDVCKQLDDVAD